MKNNYRTWLQRVSSKWVLPGCAFILALVALGAAARDKNETLLLYVNVEEDGKPVAGLNAANFRVFLDERGQAFDLEEPEIPATVVLLVENSRQSYLNREGIRNALAGFLAYAPQGHWYALAAFDHETHVVTDFTKDKSQIALGFHHLVPPRWEDASTYDAVIDLIDMVSAVPGRRVIVFVGSGLDGLSRHSFGDIEKRIEAANTTFFAIGTGFPHRGNPSPDVTSDAGMNRLHARSFITMLADKSGGDAWFPELDTLYQRAMLQVMQDLAFQYKLVVRGEVPADGRFHQVKVTAFTIKDDKRVDFKVRAREGFRRLSRSD